MKSADGQEQVLKEYLCDWPGCANVAEHVVGIARDLAMVRAFCREHAVMSTRPSPTTLRLS
jgi:hypothetical protein